MQGPRSHGQTLPDLALAAPGIHLASVTSTCIFSMKLFSYFAFVTALLLFTTLAVYFCTLVLPGGRSQLGPPLLCTSREVLQSCLFIALLTTVPFAWVFTSSSLLSILGNFPLIVDCLSKSFPAQFFAGKTCHLCQPIFWVWDRFYVYILNIRIPPLQVPKHQQQCLLAGFLDPPSACASRYISVGW